jgi:hypothetical protein
MPDNPPPPNPFESPQAVDPPTHSERWRPRWRDILIGLAVSSLAMPIVGLPAYFLASTIRSVLAHGSISYPPWSFWLEGFGFFWLPSGVFMLVVGLPVCALARRTGHLSPSASVLFGLLVYLALLSQFVIQGNWKSWTQVGMATELGWGFFASMAPFATFALYLAHLRRRDLHRSAPSLQ